MRFYMELFNDLKMSKVYLLKKDFGLMDHEGLGPIFDHNIFH
jgi:hypothetical protein